MIITLGAANYAELRRFRCHLSRNDTSPATLPTRAAHRLPSPHLTHPVRLFHLAHHDGLQPTQQVAVWSLPPQGGSEGPTPSSLAQHRFQELRLHRWLLSAFVAHRVSQFVAWAWRDREWDGRAWRSRDCCPISELLVQWMGSVERQIPPWDALAGHLLERVRLAFISRGVGPVCPLART